MSGSDEIPHVLERFRREVPRERGYPDLHDHVLALHRAGRWSSSTNRSTKIPKCIHWFAGSIAAVSPKATGGHFCSRKPPTAKAPATISPCLLPGLPPIRKCIASALAAHSMRSAPRG